MKILIFTDCYIYGGSEKLMAFLLKNEILNNNFTLLYSYRKHKIYEKGLRNEGLLYRKNNYPLILLSNNSLFHKINCLSLNFYLKAAIKIPFFLLDKFKIYFMWNLISFIYLLLKTKPNLIHINNGGYPGANTCNVLVIANFLTIKSKVLYQVNNQALTCKNYFEKIYDSFINRNVNCFINASQSAKEQLIQKRKFDPHKIYLLDNCVPLPEVIVKKQQIFKELNISEDSFLIIQVAFLSERKGQRYLIEAMSEVFKSDLISRDKIFCAFVGNGEDEKVLRNHIIELGLENNIFLLGYRSNSEDYIAASNLFVLPSIKDEDMPLVLLSAIGYGKPIIATNFAGISQVIENNFNGILLENNLATLKFNLSKEIYRCYANENFRYDIAKNAKKTYAKYSPEAYGLKLKEIYEMIYAN